ncbi:quinone oxidoreductase family protein [Mycobacterium sp. MMS18-G62]
MAIKALRARVSGFGGPEVLEIDEFTPERPSRKKVRIRVTHASVGSTDAMARSGDYLLQPRPGFTPGYDFVGVLETVDAAAERRGLRVGMRVTGCLPRMGSYTTELVLPSSRLVPLPDSLDSAQAAALPLDLVTAALAIELGRLPTGGTIFVQGVSGSVGALVSQYGRANDVKVVGTASERTRGYAESFGAHVVDYRDPNWPAQVRELTSGGADAGVDHTGSPVARAAMAPHGTLVRTAWSGRPGHGRRDAAIGGLITNLRRYASPRERVCSVPLLVALQPAKYRQMLTDQLNRITDGTLHGPAVTAVPFAEVVRAHTDFGTQPPGHKLVLQMPDSV